MCMLKRNKEKGRERDERGYQEHFVQYLAKVLTFRRVPGCATCQHDHYARDRMWSSVVSKTRA